MTSIRDQQLRLVQVGNLRSWKIAVLEFWPYAYNPRTRKLRLIDTGEARLSYSTGSHSKAVQDPIAVAMSGAISNKARSDGMVWFRGCERARPRLCDHHNQRNRFGEHGLGRLCRFPRRARVCREGGY